jgi:hypothetical protein
MTPKIAELLPAGDLRETARRFHPDSERKARKRLSADMGKPLRSGGLGVLACRDCGQAVTAGKKCTKCSNRKQRYRGLIVHDLRRSAAKALRAAGAPESVIMATGGWKTASVFRRSAIVSSADQRAVVEMLERARAENVSPRSAPFGSEIALPVAPGTDLKVQ